MMTAATKKTMTQIPFTMMTVTAIQIRCTISATIVIQMTNVPLDVPLDSKKRGRLFIGISLSI